MILVRKNIMTGYDLRLRSYHVHESSKHGIARCVYENNNIRLVVERKAKNLVLDLYFFLIKKIVLIMTI